MTCATASGVTGFPCVQKSVAWATLPGLGTSAWTVRTAQFLDGPGSSQRYLGLLAGRDHRVAYAREDVVQNVMES